MTVTGWSRRAGEPFTSTPRIGRAKTISSPPGRRRALGDLLGERVQTERVAGPFEDVQVDRAVAVGAAAPLAVGERAAAGAVDGVTNCPRNTGMTFTASSTRCARRRRNMVTGSCNPYRVACLQNPPPSCARSRRRMGIRPAESPDASGDYGAHTYERVDKPRGEFFHTNWTRSGGRVAMSTPST